MPCLPISYTNLATAATALPPTTQIYMLNLWRYRPTATYAPQHAHLSPSPCTGEEACNRYRAALRPLLPPNAGIQFMGSALTSVVAPEGETWDVVIVVRYEDLEGFRKMVECREYKDEVEPHRVAGLEEMRLIMVDKIEV